MQKFNKKEYIESIKSLHSADQADSIESLPYEIQSSILRTHTKNFHPDFIAYLREETRDDILHMIPNKQLVNLIKYLDLDDAVEILGDFETKELVQILSKLGSQQRERIEESLQYDENSAGRLMNRDYLSIKSNLTVGELIDQLRNTRRGPKDFYNIFIVDDQNIPIGYIPSGRVLRSKRSKKLKDIIYKDIHIIKSDEKIEDIAYTFRQYGLVSAPVVNLDNKMIGIMTVDDVVEIDHEESEDDMRKLGGLFVNDFYKGAFTSATSRFIWLGLNLLTAILASLVIDIYSDQLQQMIAIAVLMPIVASMGGNAGTQAMTIYVRAIATKDINNSNYIKLVVKEFLIGSINGFALSLIMGLIAYYWFDSLVLAFAISFAILINLGFACLVGIIIPITINKMKIDPALASGIVLTTFTDVFGFLSFLSIATYILNL
ncbi:MAG: magnesium transporter MgtE [Pelagibacteraceae bacterium]|nr:MAG: magnesium transporter MgtE [Pelagibacteraceae bacterium]